MPALARWLPAPLLLALSAAKVPQLILPFADAAAVMLDNLQRGGLMSGQRIGIALPVGMKGRKDRWTAVPATPEGANPQTIAS